VRFAHEGTYFLSLFSSFFTNLPFPLLRLGFLFSEATQLFIHGSFACTTFSFPPSSPLFHFFYVLSRYGRPFLEFDALCLLSFLRRPLVFHMTIEPFLLLQSSFAAFLVSSVTNLDAFFAMYILLGSFSATSFCEGTQRSDRVSFSIETPHSFRRSCTRRRCSFFFAEFL